MIKSKRNRKLAAIVLLSVILIFVAFVSFGRKSNLSDNKAEMQQIVFLVKKHIQIPNGEEPTLFTVTDSSKLTDPFLKPAENGDKLLLYPIAKKVYIYRPSIDRIIDVGPLTIDPSIAEIENTKITIYSGTTDTSKANEIIKKMKKLYPKSEISELKNANRADYTNSIVIDLTNDTKYNLVTNIIKELSMSRGVLPIGEQKPDADILIIVGNQY